VDKQKHSIPLRQVIDNGEYCQTLPIYVCPKDIYDSGGAEELSASYLRPD